MVNAEWSFFTTLFALLTSAIYYRTVTSGLVASDGHGTHESQTCLGLARVLVIATFGPRYWTWRGLGTTTALCWGHTLLLLLPMSESRTYRFGSSGYPMIEIIVLVLLGVLPLWVHVVLHTTRAFLDIAIAFECRACRILSTVFLPLVPALMVPITLIPVAIFVGMMDAESIVPRDVGGAWRGMIEMILSSWWAPRQSGIESMVAIPLGLPVIACILYMASYASRRIIYTLIPVSSPMYAIATRYSIETICVLNITYILCFGLLFGGTSTHG